MKNVSIWSCSGGKVLVYTLNTSGSLYKVHTWEASMECILFVIILFYA